MKLTISLNNAVAVTNLETLAARQGIKPTPCAAAILTQALLTPTIDPPPPPPPPTKKLKVWVCVTVITTSALVATASILTNGSTARDAAKQASDGNTRTLSTPSLVKKPHPQTSRLDLDQKAQDETLDRIVATAKTQVMWVTNNPGDVRIVGRLFEAQRKSPNLNVTLVVCPESKTPAEKLATEHGFKCYVSRSPFAAISLVAVDNDWVLNVAPMVVSSNKDSLMVDQFWGWIETGSIGKDAVLVGGKK